MFLAAKLMLSAVASRITDSQTAHQIRFYSNIGPRVPILLVAVLVALSLAIAPFWGWHVKRERDKWWRAEIAQKSVAVRTIITQGSAEAEATDEAILDALGEDYEMLKAEVKRLREANKPKVGCSAIPAECLGLRGQ